MVRHAGAKDDQALRELLESYRPVILMYFRTLTKGNTALSDDLTQQFITDKMLVKNFFALSNQKKGSFRTYLNIAVRNFFRDYLRKNKNSFNTLELKSEYISDLKSANSDSFDIIWGQGILWQCIQRFEEHCNKINRPELWVIFDHMLLSPIFNHTKAVSRSELCKHLNINDEAKISNLLTTAKLQFSKILAQLLSCTVESDSQVEDEISFMISIFSKD